MQQYWKEIICILIVKAIIFSGIWYACFKSPVVMSDESAAMHILNLK